jgi:hypothetical protein
VDSGAGLDPLEKNPFQESNPDCPVVKLVAQSLYRLTSSSSSSSAAADTITPCGFWLSAPYQNFFCL